MCEEGITMSKTHFIRAGFFGNTIKTNCGLNRITSSIEETGEPHMVDCKNCLKTMFAALKRAKK
jgi:hypothetical protein